MPQLELKNKISFFNTLSRSVEKFVPIDETNIKIYCCGPTVYNYQHIGNLRTYLFEDVLVKILRKAGYHVTHVMNITDVGHLVSDGDLGEDKMLVASRREGKKSYEIADFYTNIFFEDCEKLHINKPNIVCRASQHIQEMIKLIEQLFEKGLAYKSGPNVYFDVEKFPTHGDFAKLNKNAENLKARVEEDSFKNNPFDFVLWFTKSKFENQELQWDSPWGVGYPGWHIECSAMAMHYLGNKFDIHCGGIDHIPVHHTNEIAQSEGVTEQKWVNYWLHGGFLVTGKDKMSKSAGTFLTLNSLIEKGYDPLAYRLFCLAGDYRQELAWSWEGLDSAQNSLNKIKQTVLNLKEKIPPTADTEKTSPNPLAEKLTQEFYFALVEDLGTAKAMASFYQVLNSPELSAAEKVNLLEGFDEILGLGISSWIPEEVLIPEDVKILAEQRQVARVEKNWGEADRLRNEIHSKGFTVEDLVGGFELKKLQKI